MSYVSTVLADNPIGYWRLNEAAGPSAVDITGKGHTGTYSATGIGYRTTVGPIIDDPTDNAIYLDGASGSVTIPQGGDFPAAGTAFSMEAWILQATPTIGPILEFGTTATWAPHMWEYPNPGDMLFNPSMTTGGGQAYAVLTQTMVWHHVVSIYDGASTVYMYCDGVVVYAGPVTGPAVNGGTQNPLNIGHRPMTGGVYWLTGRVDEVALYGTALSAARVAAHYQAGIQHNYFGRVRADAPLGYWRLGESSGPAYDWSNRYRATVLADAPTAYWRLNERSGTEMGDSSGNNHLGTYAGTTYLAQGGSPIASDSTASVYFDGASGRIDVNDFAVTAPFSVECWLYLNIATQQGGGGIIGRRTAANVGGFTMEFSGAGGSINCHIYTDTWHPIVTSSLAFATWYHFVFTADAAGNTIAYLNGVVNVTGGPFGAMGQPGACTFQIGKNQVGAVWYTGYMTDVAIYPTVLTAAKVALHYRVGQGHVGTYAPTGVTYAQAGALAGDADGSVALAGTSGVSGLVSLATGSDFRPVGGGWSMEAWINPTTMGGTQEIVRLGGGDGWFLRNGGGFVGTLFGMQGGVFPTPTGGVIPGPNVWSHIVGVYDGSFIRHYVNGVQVFSVAETRTFGPTSTLNVAIGSQDPGSGGEFFQGRVDEVAVYNYALSAAQVLDHYRRGIGLNTVWNSGTGAFNTTGTLPLAYWSTASGSFRFSSTQQVVWPGAGGVFAPVT